MHEPDPTRRGLGQQPGDDAGLEPGDDAVLVGIGRVHEHLDIGFLAHGGGEAQDGHGGRGQPGQAPSEHVPHAFGHFGHGHQRTLASQQLRALDQVEGVPSGTDAQRLDDAVVDGTAVDGTDQRGRVRSGQAGQGQPGGRAPGQGGQGLIQLAARFRGPVGRYQQQRGARQPGRHGLEQGQRLRVGLVQVVEEDSHGPGGRGVPQPGDHCLVEPEARRRRIFRGGAGPLAGI